MKQDRLVWDGVTSWYIRADGRTRMKIDSRNFRRKWVSQCIAIDFVNNKTEAYLDGRRIDFNRFIRATNGKMSEAKDLAMVVTLGHYYFDNKPLIGKIVDVNIWSRYLTDDEGRNYSDCKVYIPRAGDLVNSSTKFMVTGTLVKPFSVESDTILCNIENSINHLFLHAPFKRQIKAREACDKYALDSMAGPFQDIDVDWKLFHKRASSNPAVRQFCWTGGRMLHWQSYMSYHSPEVKDYNFVNVITNETLKFSPWRASQPNDRLRKNLCVLSYIGLPHNACWYDMSCVQSSWQWAGCVGCWLPHTAFDGVVIYMRGLCEKSLFDTEYQVSQVRKEFFTKKVKSCN